MNSPMGERRIRLILLDEQGLSRTSLARLLALETDFEVVAECGSSSDALEAVAHSSIDVVLLDLDFGAASAANFIEVARQAGFQGQFLIIAGTADVESSAMVLKLGTSGIFLKTEALERLIQAIRLVASGGVWVDRKIIYLFAEWFGEHSSSSVDLGANRRFSERERSVVRGILGGLTNRRIANGMGLSEGAVKNILQGLFARAGVRTRSQLVRLALEGSFENYEVPNESAGQPGPMTNLR